MAEYIAKINDSKKEAVADLKSRFDGISSFIFTDYRGLTVAQITEIRDKLRTSDTEFKVVKNRFAKIAMKDLGITDVDDFLKGPTAVAAVPGESNEVAKALFEFAKGGMPLQVKGAVIDGELFDAAKKLNTDMNPEVFLQKRMYPLMLLKAIKRSEQIFFLQQPIQTER